MHKKVFRSAMNLQRPLFLQSMLVADCVAFQMLLLCENPSISPYLRAKCCRSHGAYGAVSTSNRAGSEPTRTERFSVANEADASDGLGQPMCRGANQTDLTLECCR